MTTPLHASREERLTAELEEAQAALEHLRGLRSRLEQEHLTVTVYTEKETGFYEQMFFDVADNALGINQAVKVRFDARRVVNRTIDEVSKHALLTGRVDMEQDRIVGSNPNLVGAKHVTDMVRAITVGVVGRIGARREQSLEETELVEAANDFLDTLTGGFKQLSAVADGDLTPVELRGKSLLGSITMLRVLAGVYFNLRDEHEFDDDAIQDFWSVLEPHLNAPVSKDSLILQSGDVDTGQFGPQARSQNLKHLAEWLTAWAVNGVAPHDEEVPELP